MTNYEDIASGLSPEFQKKLKRASEVTDDRQEMASVGLTTAMSGGLCYGATTLIMGNYGSGKTALALQTAGMAQKDGKTVAMIDAEGSFKPEWARKLGVDTDNMLWLNVKAVDKVADLNVELMQNGVDYIIIDSISKLGNAQHVDRESGEIKKFGDNNQMGQVSTSLGKLLMLANMAQDHSALVLISQNRNNIQTGGSYGFIPSGGKAMEHDPTTIIELNSSHSDSKRLKGMIDNGRKMIEKPIGNTVRWTLKKHRGSGDGLSGEYNFYYDGPMLGVDNVSEIVTEATKAGVIDKRGPWFFLENGEKFQGQANLTKYLRENDAEFETVKSGLYAT